MKKVFSLLTIFLSIFICSKVYAYKSYKIGDEVTYNGIDFYVIKDSSEDEDYVTLLKAEPLTVEEVNTYGGVGTDNNHVNKYTNDYQEKTINTNGYGGLTYYSSDVCKTYHNDNCINNYNKSDIVHIVDNWAKDKFSSADLKEDRLISLDELISNLGYKKQLDDGYPRKTYEYIITEKTPKWVYDSKYDYWTMDVALNSEYCSTGCVWMVSKDGYIYSSFMHGSYDGEFFTVRPVIELSKSALPGDDDNQDSKIIDDDHIKEDALDNKVESKQIVNVPNTLKSVSGLVILIGMVLVCVGLNIFIIIKNKDRKKD